MKNIQAWHIVEIMPDGTKRHMDTIRTPDAEERAKRYAEKIRKEQSKNVVAEPFEGPFTDHY